jgi:hypothetical protein
LLHVPLAWLELAQMISMFSSANARPTSRHTRTSLSVRLVHAENRCYPSKRATGSHVQCFEVGGPCSRWARRAAASVGSSRHRSRPAACRARLSPVNPRDRPLVKPSFARKRENSDSKFGQHPNPFIG